MKRFLLLLLLLSACGPPAYIEPNYFQGNEGLVVTVNANTPNAIYEGSTGIFTVRIENVGATRVNYSYLNYNLDSDPFYLAVQDDQVGFDSKLGFLYGKELGYPLGDYVDISHYIQAKSVLGTRAKPQTQLFGSICYPYETILADTICVDSNAQNGNVQPQVCTAQNHVYQDQGAPVAVTLIENKPTPVLAIAAGGGALPILQPTFIVHITNVGGGTVVMPIEPEDAGVFAGTRVEAFPPHNKTGAALLSSYFYDKYVNKGVAAQPNTPLEQRMRDACLQRQTTYTNAVRVYATLSNTTLDCVPAQVPIVNDEGFTTCKLPFGNDYKLYSPNYEGNLQVRLAYMYKASFVHDIEILRSDVPQVVDVTIDEMNQNPGYIEGQIRCEYCSQNPNDPRCKEFAGNKYPLSCDWNPLIKSCSIAADTRVTAEVKSQPLDRSFRCGCGPAECTPGRANGKVDCIYGSHLCPTGGVCCAESFAAEYARLYPNN